MTEDAAERSITPVCFAYPRPASNLSHSSVDRHPPTRNVPDKVGRLESSALPVAFQEDGQLEDGRRPGTSRSAAAFDTRGVLGACGAELTGDAMELANRREIV